jgi:hypothetical protein
MLSKANARRVEEQKETIFVISGRVWTLESVEKRARRAGIQGGTEVQAGKSLSRFKLEEANRT